MKPKIIKTRVKEIFTRSKLPGCSYVINHYVGCGHNCTYCYARFMARWKDFGPWGSWVEVKENAAELVKGRLVKGPVFMSSVSDCYQQIEKELGLTRAILENMDKNIELSILTKSDLVLRDIDILKQFKNVEVGFTINTFSGKEKELFEPDSPTNEQRLNALKVLKDHGIKTYVFVSPIIPGLVDIEEIVAKTMDYAEYYFFETINMKGAGFDFCKILRYVYPQSYDIVTNQQLFAGYVADLRKMLDNTGIDYKLFAHQKSGGEKKTGDKNIEGKKSCDKNGDVEIEEKNLELF